MYANTSFAYNINSVGKAKINKENSRAAYHKSINNGLLAAIRAYYRTQNFSKIDVNEDYFKFIKGYTITSQKIVDDVIETSLFVKLDELALNDARIFMQQHTDSVVFSFSGIPKEIIPTQTLQTLINNTLQYKQFSTSNQSDFLGQVQDFNNEKEVEKAFKKINSIYYFDFKFLPLADSIEFKDPNNKCEIMTSINILSKNKDNKELQLTTGSKHNTLKYCYSESVELAVNQAIDYVRENIILLPENSATLQKYKIKLIYPTNMMIIVNNIMDTLKQRGLVKNAKPVSFSQKLAIFEVESFFTIEDLQNKIQTLNLKKKPNITVNNKEIVLNFSE